MSKRTTNKNGLTIVSYNLNELEHDSAVELITENKREVNGYAIEEDDDEMVSEWINEFAETDAEYSAFLLDALKNGNEIYTLTENCGWKQPIGEVVAY